MNKCLEKGKSSYNGGLTFEKPILGVGGWCNDTSWHLNAETDIRKLISCYRCTFVWDYLDIDVMHI